MREYMRVWWFAGVYNRARAGDSSRSRCHRASQRVTRHLVGVTTAGADDADARTPALVADVAHTPYPGRRWAVALPACLSTFIHHDLWMKAIPPYLIYGCDSVSAVAVTWYEGECCSCMVAGDLSIASAASPLNIVQSITNVELNYLILIVA